MNRGLPSLYLVPWTKKNPGNRTDRRHSFSHDEAVEAKHLSDFSKGAKCASRSLEAAFGMLTIVKQKRVVMKVTYEGETMSIGRWAKKKGLSYQCLRLRILHGWPLDIAMETPIASIKRLGDKRIK